MFQALFNLYFVECYLRAHAWSPLDPELMHFEALFWRNVLEGCLEE